MLLQLTADKDNQGVKSVSSETWISLPVWVFTSCFTSCLGVHFLLHFLFGSSLPASCKNELLCSGLFSHQFEEVDELVGVLAARQVHKVTGDPVAQTGARLDCHLAGGVAERRGLLDTHTHTQFAP